MYAKKLGLKVTGGEQLLFPKAALRGLVYVVSAPMDVILGINKRQHLRLKCTKLGGEIARAPITPPSKDERRRLRRSLLRHHAKGRCPIHRNLSSCELVESLVQSRNAHPLKQKVREILEEQTARNSTVASPSVQ